MHPSPLLHPTPAHPSTKLHFPTPLLNLLHRRLTEQRDSVSQTMNNKSMEWQQTLGGRNPTFFFLPTSRQEFRRGRARVVFCEFWQLYGQKPYPGSHASRQQ